MSDLIQVEVAYASVKEQRVVQVSLPVGSTLLAAIQASGVLEVFPDIDLARQKVGVFSKRRQLTDEVKEGDRVEIYRSLQAQPMEARRSKSAVVKRKKGR
ncbi:MAG: hypothetical protein A3E85_04690 [Gammaproteobacteria bacterium RIFCSPHIGHO2_12_FULL_45_12]|nr:MAG: hypothetical protein A3E85_04690 [Gammaproteobacteria bacterium RIFCSPHIGHO2_12_FULL_45_12]